ncbi:HipA family kinase [Pedobacter ghigonis]|uniref:HipA family kinase n=1 Tax=Pedobacter ghigonis TaxID=2730403 RepID=UPI00158D87EF|nr:HipA family kinase [Pedobacter ghigonis]
MLNIRSSIAKISRVIPTGGSLPVVVMADNLEDYVCKYDFGTKLINEYLGHQFLQLWEIGVFSAAFVNIKRDHVPAEILNGRIQGHLFDKPCFGLQYENNALSVNDIIIGSSGDRYELDKFEDRFSLMDIGLFDLWLANDDRNQNNSNLLLLENRLVPIDHSNLFDGDGLGRELSPLTWEDSIIHSDIAKVLLNSKLKREARHQQLLEQFPIFVSRCRQALPDLIAGIPNQWCNDKALLREQITSSVMDNQKWLDQTISSFSELIHNFNR